MEQSTETKAAIKKEVEAKFSTQSKYDSLMHLGKSNRAFGIVGCILGPVFVVSGGGLIIGALYEPNITVRNLYFGLGGVIMACGVAESIVGPIGLIKGKKQIDAAQQYKGQVSMTMPSLRLTDFSPRSGIGLGTRITF